MSVPAKMKKTLPPLPPSPRSLPRRMSRSKHPVQEDDDAILLMGATGAGKSSFISSLGLPAKVGHSLKSCTVNPEGWRYETAHGRVMTIIDTPGFNDSSRPDMEILQAIVDYVLSVKLRVVAVMYIQRINERKFSGSIRTNLAMLRAIAGQHFYQNVILATSMWSTIPPDQLLEAHEREREFQITHSFWGELLEKGATYYAWDETGTAENGKTATQLVNMIKAKPHVPELNIILEVNRGIVLEETEAGKILTAELRKRQELEKQRLQEEEMNLRELQQRLAELRAEAARGQEEVQRQQRRSRRESLGHASPLAAVQAARHMFSRREPAVSSASPQYSSGPIEDVAPPYEANESLRNLSTSLPVGTIERRSAVGHGLIMNDREQMSNSTKVAHRMQTPSAAVPRSGDEHRGRAERRWVGSVTGHFRRHSEHAVVKKRRPKKTSVTE